MCFLRSLVQIGKWLRCNVHHIIFLLSYVIVCESAYNIGDPGLISGSGRSPGEGNGNPLQYSCLENAMDWGA